VSYVDRKLKNQAYSDFKELLILLVAAFFLVGGGIVFGLVVQGKFDNNVMPMKIERFFDDVRKSY